MVEMKTSLDSIFAEAQLSDLNIITTFDDELIQVVKSRYLVNESEAIIALLDTSYNNSGKDGVLFTDKALYWRNDSTIDSVITDKGSYSYEELQKSGIEFEEKLTTTWVSFRYTEYREDTYVVTLKLLADQSKDIQSLFEKLERVVKGLSPDEEIPTSYYSADIQCVDSFVGATDEQSQIKYRKLFYTFDQTDAFKPSWNWAAFIFGPIYLFHKKLNKEAGIALGISIISLLISPVLYAIVAAVIGICGDFLLHQRYKLLLKLTSTDNLGFEEKLSILSSAGGSSLVTNALAFVSGIIIVIMVLFGPGVFTAFNPTINIVRNGALSSAPSVPLDTVMNAIWSSDISWGHYSKGGSEYVTVSGRLRGARNKTGIHTFIFKVNPASGAFQLDSALYEGKSQDSYYCVLMLQDVSYRIANYGFDKTIRDYENWAGR